MTRRHIAAAALAATLMTTIAATGCGDEAAADSAAGDEEIVAAQAPFTIPDKSQARVAEYWTPARMRAAVPYEPATGKATEDEAHYPSEGTACVRSAESCTNGEGAYAYDRTPADPAGIPGRSVGKVFFSKAGKPYVCSGSVVESANRSVVWTAGHCVANRGQFHSNWIFVPGYRDGVAPNGRWVPRAGQSSMTLAKWLDDRDGRYDLAAVVLASEGGQGVAERVGSLPIVFDQSPEPGQPVRILGYPQAAPFDGSDLEVCVGQVAERDEPPYINDSEEDGSSTAPAPGTPSGYRVGCDLTGGASGGPFLLGPADDGTGGSVFSVVSSGPVTAVTGAYQGELARALWERAQTFE